MTKLTELRIKNAKALTGERLLADGGGLYLRIRPGSAPKTWLFRYRLNGRTRKMQIGSYPLVSLAQARERAQELSKQHRGGEDPAELRDRRKQEELDAQKALAVRVSVNQLYERWLAIDLARHKDSGQFVKRIFQKDVIPVIGSMWLREVTKADIATVCDAILARGSQRMAKMTLSLMRQFFRFGVDRGLIEADPTAGIRKSRIGGRDTSRERTLSDQEIRLLASALPQSGLSEPVQIAVWLALSTCCRIGEIAQARWSDIDLPNGLWRIPAENSKNGRPHKIFLSRFTVELLERLRTINAQTPLRADGTDALDIGPSTHWLYPARCGTRSVAGRTLSKQIMDRQRLGVPPLGKRANLAVCNALALPDGRWTPHDLRRTGCTIMVRSGFSPTVCERALNHVEENRLMRIYQVYEYEPELKAAWHRLGDHLQALTHPVPAHVRKVA